MYPGNFRNGIMCVESFSVAKRPVVLTDTCVSQRMTAVVGPSTIQAYPLGRESYLVTAQQRSSTTTNGLNSAAPMEHASSVLVAPRDATP